MTAGIVCIVLAILGIVYFLYNYFVSDLFTKTEEDVVPTLIGANYDELKLSDYPNFKIEIQEWRASDEYAYGYILDQSPAPGRTVKVGSTVGLIVSSGAEEKKMPDLVNMTLQNALTSLNTMSIPVTANPIYEESDVVTDGYVIRTEPAKDEPLTEGQVVNIYVSLGTAADLVRVPSLVGMTVENAKALIEAKGLSVGSATAVESDLPEGRSHSEHRPGRGGSERDGHKFADIKVRLTLRRQRSFRSLRIRRSRVAKHLPWRSRHSPQTTAF